MSTIRHGRPAGSRLRGPAWFPRCGSPDLLTCDARCRKPCRRPAMRRRIGEDLLLDAHVAEDLHRPLIGDVRAGRVRRPAILGDHDVRYAERRQEQRSRRTRWPAADDQTSVSTTAEVGNSVSASPSLNSGTPMTPSSFTPETGPAEVAGPTDRPERPVAVLDSGPLVFEWSWRLTAHPGRRRHRRCCRATAPHGDGQVRRRVIESLDVSAHLGRRWLVDPRVRSPRRCRAVARPKGRRTSSPDRRGRP